MTPARSSWRRLPAAVLTAGVAALSAVPVAVLPAALPAAATMRTPTAGPVETSCVGAHRYAAEAGAQLLRLHRLDLRPAGHTEPPVTGIGLGTARSVLVAESPINSAAAAQVLDGHVSEQAAPAALTRQLYQQAPPDNRAPRRSTVAAQQAGPLSIGAAKLASHARWLAPMACGAGWGEVTAAQTGLAGATLLTGTGGRALISVPAGLTSLSSTALDRRGANVHTVARAAATMPDIRLLAGAVRLRVLRPPRLQTSIAASPGSAEVRYA
ncbi:MAG TPA: hypothetical protein VFO77_13460, partial [Actinoplanes sp.]|nr:hypothetical protein [Actinoplanes sp.]